MMQTFTARPLFVPDSEELRFLPEGPHVLRNFPGAPSLGWVAIQHGSDLKQGSLNVLDLATGVNRSVPLPGRPGFFVETTRPGVVLVGLERRLVLVDLQTGAIEETGAALPEDERIVINDGAAVEGGVLFGTKHLEFNQAIAALYFFDPVSRVIRTVLGGQTCSNGKVLIAEGDGPVLYDIDSTPKLLSRHRLDAGLERVVESSAVIAPEALPAFPDGMRQAPASVEDGDSVVVAFYNPEPVADGLAWQIRLSDGAVLCEWRVPGAPRVTCPEFVELDGEVKIVFTTAVEGMPDAMRPSAPGSGNLFIADTPFLTMPSEPALLGI